jgi:glyoxylase-like metal-dependent hydrolase (beta-lactamase superfamily II)
VHKVTFFPLGNADCCRIDLHDGRKILFDYANTRNPDDESDRRCDLPTLLAEDLESADKNEFDVVAFTHLDDDHVCGAPDFFYLEHAEKYRVKGRPKIGELWVPAAALVEEGLDGDARVIRGEARHRFKNKSGIRVFT